MKTNYVCNECNTNLEQPAEYCTMCAPHMKSTKEDIMSDFEKQVQEKLQTAEDWHKISTYLADATSADEVYAIKRELQEKYPAMYVRQEKALDKRCRNMAYKFNKGGKVLDDGAKKFKQEVLEQEAWLREHDMLDDQLPSEKEVMAKQLGLEPNKVTYSEWEEQAIEFYRFIKACREASGENVSLYWRGATSSNVSMEAENSDNAVDFVSSGAPIEKWGNLETALRLFTEGIQTGKQFDNTFRTTYFEEGLNAADSYHADIDYIGTENVANKIRKMNKAYTKNLVKSMEEKSFRVQQRIENAEKNIDSWMEQAKENVRLKLSVCKTRKDAERVRVYDAIRPVVRKATDYAYNMPFTNVKVIKFDTPVTKEVALKALKEAKGRNSMVISDLNEFKAELIATRFASEFKAFEDVKNYLSMIVDLDVESAVIKLLQFKVVSKQQCKNALAIASSRSNKCRFTREEFTILAKAKLVQRRAPRAKKVDTVSPATAELVKRLQNGDFDAATPQNAQDILKASYTGKKYRLPKETYYYVKALVA